ncbi:alpha/beta fold hydrolase [Actinoplanes sp. NPDC051346]|uniref:alpha/beta fold hydrolase n=1 Tax=Actinoplanes sp. NPDC051346 TaxID=3155048 RepID=UPI00344A65DF
MFRNTRLRTLTLAALSVTAVAAGVTVLTTTRESSATPRSTIAWKACTADGLAGLDCGTLKVPVDWEKPRGEKTTLAVVRRRADGPNRIGPLLLNNGGGSSPIEQLRLGLKAGLVKAPLATRFDLIAVDPRGVGESSPISCGRPQRRAGVTYFPRTQAQFQALAADNADLAKQCRRLTGSLFDHLDTASSVRDFDAVREALGAKKVTWYGIHGSTSLGRAYAQMFPHRLRGMVLDTAVDDTLDPVTRLAGESTAAETALVRWAAWCDTTASCALKGKSSLAAFDRLVKNADAKPIRARSLPSLTGEDVRRAAQEHLVQTLAWPRFGQAIKEALAGNAATLAASPDDTLSPVQAHVLNCVNTPPAAATLADLTQLSAMTRSASPHVAGATRAYDTAAGCIGWPHRATRPASPAPARTTPPALILQSTHQSLAAYSEGFSLARQLPGSRVLTREGDDYSMILFSGCVQDAFGRYLTQQKLPAPGSTCKN